MKISKTEQHLYNTIKKILKNHFYQLQSVECYSNYAVGQIVYLIRFYERIGVHGKRDVSVFDVFVRDTKLIEFDIVAVEVKSAGTNQDFLLFSAAGIKKDQDFKAEYKHSNVPTSDLNAVLKEFIWEVSKADRNLPSHTFIDLRAFIKSFFVIKNVVKVNDTINERIMLEVLNHHV